MIPKGQLVFWSLFFVLLSFLAVGNANPCDCSPCANGGTCTNTSASSYNCTCLPQYIGSNCGTDNPCYNVNCDNGGVCLPELGYCFCPGYTYPTCSNRDYCFNVSCENGGTCLNGDDGYKCLCKYHYMGQNCSDYMTYENFTSPHSLIAYNCNETCGIPLYGRPDSQWIACCQSIFDDTCCPSGCGNDTVLADFLFIRTCEESRCQIPKNSDECSDICAPATEVECEQESTSPCKNVSPNSCLTVPGCTLVTGCFPISVGSSVDCTVSNQNICNNRNGCYWTQLCTLDCNYQTFGGCSNATGCLASSHPTCVFTNCATFDGNRNGCEEYSGCVYDAIFDRCTRLPSTFSLNNECPYPHGSSICNQWNECQEPDSLVCKSLIQEYCCGFGLLDGNQLCIDHRDSEDFICQSNCTMDGVECPSLIRGIWKASLVFREPPTTSGHLSSYFYFAANDTFLFLDHESRLFSGYQLCQGFQIDLFFQGQSDGAFIRSMYQQSEVSAVLTTSIPGICQIPSSSSYYIEYGLTEATTCELPNEICTSKPECDVTDSFECKASEAGSSHCNPLSYQDCGSDSRCQRYDTCSGAQGCEGLDYTSCLSANADGCSWQTLCIPNCKYKTSSDCHGDCQWKEGQACSTIDCSVLEGCAGGCAYMEVVGKCLPSFNRFNSSLSCPFAPSSVCEEFYFCDPINPNYNTTTCQTITESFCCGQGILSNNTFCKQKWSNNEILCSQRCSGRDSVVPCPMNLTSLWSNQGSTYVGFVEDHSVFSDGSGQIFLTSPPICTLVGSTIRYYLEFTGDYEGVFLTFSLGSVEPNAIGFGFGDFGSCTHNEPSTFYLETNCKQPFGLCEYADVCSSGQIFQCISNNFSPECGSFSPEVCKYQPGCEVAFSCFGENLTCYSLGVNQCYGNGCYWGDICRSNCAYRAPKDCNGACSLITTPQCQFDRCDQAEPSSCYYKSGCHPIGEGCGFNSSRFNFSESCPYEDYNYCLSYYACDPTLDAYNETFCAESDRNYCCEKGIVAGNPFCSLPKFQNLNCTDDFNSCSQTEHFNECQNLEGVWILRHEVKPQGSSLDPMVAMIFYDGFVNQTNALFDPSARNTRIGATCWTDGENYIDLAYTPTLRLPVSYSFDSDMNITLSYFTPNSCSGQPNSYSAYSKDLDLSYCQVNNLASCNALPQCYYSNQPKCKPKLLNNPPPNYEQICDGQTTSADCLLNNCEWGVKGCVLADCYAQSPFPEFCQPKYGCRYAGDVCHFSTDRFSTQCPFDPSSAVCIEWELCLEDSPIFAPSDCIEPAMAECCSLNDIIHPPICSQVLTFTDEKPTCSSFHNCPFDDSNWVECPNLVTKGIWRSNIPINSWMSATRSVGAATPLYQLAFDAKNDGVLSRSYSVGAIIDPSLPPVSVPVKVLCSGNFESTFQVKILYQGDQAGYISKGVFFPPSSQDVTDSQTMGLAIRLQDDSCEWPIFPSASAHLALGKAVSSSSSVGCENPVSISLPADLSGAVTKNISISAQISVSPCATNITLGKWTWLITPIPAIFVPTATGPNLVIPARMIPVGGYTIKAQVGNYSATTTLTITSVAPVIRLSPAGTKQLISTRKDFTLNATGSFNPNLVQGDQVAPLTFEWRCSDLNGNPCGGSLNLNTSILTFPALFLPENSHFVVSVTVTAENQQSTKVVYLDTVAEVVAELEIQVQGQSPDGFVNGAKPVRLLGRVKRSTTTTDFSKLSLSWTSVGGEGLQPPLPLLSNTTLLSETNTFNLVIRPNILSSGLPYRFRLTASDGIGSGYGEIELKIYPVPSGGLLLVDPLQGIFRNTSFSLQAIFWSDSISNSFLYNFAVGMSGRPLFFLRQKASNSNSMSTFNLPVGNLTLYAVISSEFGSTLSDGVKVEVLPEDQKTSLQVSQDLKNGLNSSLENQDQDGTIQLVTLLTNLVNNASGDNSTFTEEDLRRFRKTLVTALHLTSQFSELSSDDANQIVPLLKEITAFFEQLDLETQVTVLELTSTLAQLSQEVALDFATVLSTLLDSLMLSVGNDTTVNGQVGDKVIFLYENLRALFIGLLGELACNELPTTLETSNFKVEGRLQNSFASFVKDQFSFGPGFSPSSLSSSGSSGSNDSFDLGQVCSQMQYTQNQGNPFSWKVNPAYDAKSDVISMEFFDEDGHPILVQNLRGNSTIRIKFPDAFNITGKPFDKIECIFWAVQYGNWNTTGCTKLLDPEGIFTCECSHLTSFSIGPISIRANTIDPSRIDLLGKLLDSTGGILSIAICCALVGLYLILFPIFVYLDRKDFSLEKTPSPEDLKKFIEDFHKLYNRKVDIEVLQTKCLAEWFHVYELNKLSDPSYHPGFWDLVRVHLKDGFRQQHLYVSLFFRPVSGYTRPQRLTVIFAILFCSLTVNAFLFQYDQDDNYTRTGRIIAAVISSGIVFVATTLHGFLFKRCKRRVEHSKFLEDYSPGDLAKMEIDTEKLTSRNFFVKMFVDWHLPWWFSIILYIVAYLSWIFCIYTVLLFAVTFENERVMAYFESYLISLALSIFFFQTGKAIVGGLFITITSGAISIALFTGIAAGNLFAMN